MYESQAFWNVTLLAHYDTVLFRLARFYDQHPAALSLKRFLLTVKTCMLYFADEVRRQRLSHSPHVENLLPRLLNLALGGDIRRSSESDPLVGRLCQLRNQALSHVEPNPVRLGTTAKLPWLTDRQIGMLLRRGRKIINRYSLIYRASLVSDTVIGANDFTMVLSHVRAAHQAIVAQGKKEVRQLAALAPRAQANGLHKKSQRLAYED